MYYEHAIKVLSTLGAYSADAGHETYHKGTAEGARSQARLQGIHVGKHERHKKGRVKGQQGKEAPQQHLQAQLHIHRLVLSCNDRLHSHAICNLLKGKTLPRLSMLHMQSLPVPAHANLLQVMLLVGCPTILYMKHLQPVEQLWPHTQTVFLLLGAVQSTKEWHAYK